MSQRDSGYKRRKNDDYPTPDWVTRVITQEFPPIAIWEPAAGKGKMVAELRRVGYKVIASDITKGVDFLTTKKTRAPAIITNPPYAFAQEFIEHALELEGVEFIAMLLRTDFDHAKTRQHLFSECKAFSRKIVLTQRIRWIEGSKGSPSFNHAWFVWEPRREKGPPSIFYV